MKKSFIQKVTTISTLAVCLMATTAFAVSSMTYNGYGIRGKRSIGRITVDSGISVSHTNSDWNVPSGQEMDISADLSTWHGWSTQDTHATYGSGTTNFDFSGLSSGTYSLYFEAPNDPACANISGSASGY